MTEHFPSFDCVVSSRKEFVCDADSGVYTKTHFLKLHPI